jgi:hypothetical protein
LFGIALGYWHGVESGRTVLAPVGSSATTEVPKETLEDIVWAVPIQEFREVASQEAADWYVAVARGLNEHSDQGLVRGVSLTREQLFYLAGELHLVFPREPSDMSTGWRDTGITRKSTEYGVTRLFVRLHPRAR